MTPQLRFKVFEGSWSVSTLSEVTDKITDGTHHSPQLLEKGLYKYISSKNIRNGKMLLDNVPFVSEKDHKKIYSRCDVQLNDVLLTKDGASTGNVCLNVLKEPFSMLSSVALIRGDLNVIANDFIYQFLLSPQGQKEVRAEISGQAITRITLTKLKKFRISYPSEKSEQAKLCDFLAMIDKKINLLTKKKEALETYKKGLMKKIFSQELRFKRENGTDYPEWTNYKLSEVLTEHKMHSNGNEQVHSVSVHKGVVNQIEHLGRSFAANDVSNYNKVFYGDVIYTKSPTGDFPYGIIKQSYVENAIVSPLYCVTSPIDINLGFLLNWFFESKINVHNYLHPIVQKGAKNTINITNKTFLSRSLFLPSDKGERQKIKVLYSSLNKNLKTLEAEISKVKEFKKGLLQQMFV